MSRGKMFGLDKLGSLFKRSGKEAKFAQAPDEGGIMQKISRRAHSHALGSDRTKQQAHRHTRELAGRAANMRRMQIAQGKPHAKVALGRTNAKRRHARNTANAMKRSGWIEAGR